MDIHYYMLCFRYEALVASQLEPEAFGRYMAVGTQKHTRGNAMFFEVHRGLKSDYFRLHDIEERCVPHADGSPKRSKYISIYRVLEHLSPADLGTLYLVTADGRVMPLEPSTEQVRIPDHDIHLYHELCPVSPLVVSALAPDSFVDFMTGSDNPMRVPRIFFADLLLDRDDTGHLAGYLPYNDPMHIIDCVEEVRKGGGKKTKTVARNPANHGFFRSINRGFFLGDPGGVKFYPFPERRVLEVNHAKWWRSASESLA